MIPANFSSSSLNRIYFKNFNNGYIYRYPVSYTTDGGQNWSTYPYSTFNGVISGIHFPDSISSIGYAIKSTGGIIYKTIDNGLSWFSVATPSSQSYYDVFFVNNLTGYVLGSNFIIKTVDGGLNWAVLNSSVGGKKIKFINDTTCYVINGSEIYKSIDGGISFSAMTGTNSTINDLIILNNNIGYCAGNYGELYKIDLSSSIQTNIQKINEIVIFPNPILDKLSINTPEDGIVRVLDLFGSILYYGAVTTGTNTIELKNFSSGIFLFEFKNNSTFVIQYFVNF